MSITQVAPVARTPRLSEKLNTIAQRFGQYRLYRNTLNELQSLSDRDLNDLGLARGMLRSVAYEAAYKS